MMHSENSQDYLRRKDALSLNEILTNSEISDKVASAESVKAFSEFHKHVQYYGNVDGVVDLSKYYFALIVASNRFDNSGSSVPTNLYVYNAEENAVTLILESNKRTDGGAIEYFYDSSSRFFHIKSVHWGGTMHLLILGA